MVYRTSEECPSRALRAPRDLGELQSFAAFNQFSGAGCTPAPLSANSNASTWTLGLQRARFKDRGHLLPTVCNDLFFMYSRYAKSMIAAIMTRFYRTPAPPRTRRTDGVLCLTLRARGSMRAWFGGEGTRLANARRARGDG